VNIPETVTDPSDRALYDACNQARMAIKSSAVLLDELLRGRGSPHMRGERGANITLAYRHLEDASMRLGKALQAIDGGVSVYDRATTVGA
jgi:hypothetical protein